MFMQPKYLIALLIIMAGVSAVGLGKVLEQTAHLKEQLKAKENADQIENEVRGADDDTLVDGILRKD